MESVAIVGVGLIGGSFALALRKAGFRGEILGVSSEATLRQALEDGVIDRGLPLEAALARADLVYLSHSVARILELLPAVNGAARPGALITDAGSTKSAIVERARATRGAAKFLGGHPLAGKESRGVGAADADLFRDRTYLLTPLDPAHMQAPPVVELVEWLRRIGARPVEIDAREHDRILAFTSHLPQLVSTALAATAAAHLPARDPAPFAGPGLIDMTRLALSPYEIWRDILETNSTEIENALDACLRQLGSLRQGLTQPSLRAEFDRAAEFAHLLRRKPA